MEISESDSEIRITMGRTTIGYIVRSKRNENHSPSLQSQHADCIRPYGELIGFSARKGPATGGQMCASWNCLSLNLKGKVLEVNDLIYHSEKNPVPTVRDEALKMISADFAQKSDFISAVLIINAPESVTNRFICSWERLKENPKNFNLFGGNCAVRAQDIFVEAGLLSKKRINITPNQLFHILSRELEGRGEYHLKKYFGYIGFEENIDGGYDLVIKT